MRMSEKIMPTDACNIEKTSGLAKRRREGEKHFTATKRTSEVTQMLKYSTTVSKCLDGDFSLRFHPAVDRVTLFAMAGSFLICLVISDTQYIRITYSEILPFYHLPIRPFVHAPLHVKMLTLMLIFTTLMTGHTLAHSPIAFPLFIYPFYPQHAPVVQKYMHSLM